MWVIPLILSEEMTEKLPEEILIQLAECSTSIIKKRVKNYLNSMEANKEIFLSNCNRRIFTRYRTRKKGKSNKRFRIL